MIEPRFTKDHPRRVLCVTVLNAKRLPMTSDDGILEPDSKFHLALFLNNQRVDVSIPVPARLPGDSDNGDDRDYRNDGNDTDNDDTSDNANATNDTDTNNNTDNAATTNNDEITAIYSTPE